MSNNYLPDNKSEAILPGRKRVQYAGLSPIQLVAVITVVLLLLCGAAAGTGFLINEQAQARQAADQEATDNALEVIAEYTEIAVEETQSAAETAVVLTQGVIEADRERALAATDAARPTVTPRPIPTATELPTVTPLSDVASRCPGAPPIRLSEGERGVVLGIDNHQIRLRSTPSIYGETITSIRIGQEFTVLDGPVCADDFTWFRVEFEGGLRGYMAEGYESTYYIEPVN